MNIARVCRWTAVALAAIAIVDPRLPLPRRERPSIRVVGDADDVPLVGRLRAAGFATAANGEAATVLTSRAHGAPSPPSAPLYVLREDAGPEVSIAHAWAPASRVAGQAIAVTVSVRARGGRGATTTLQLEDGGLAVASATHEWRTDDETWQATLSYLPDGGARRLRIRADALRGERHVADNAADVSVPPVRGPVRVLVIESGVTWPAAFARRSLEASAGFAVAAVQRTTKTVITRAGSPPRGLTRRDLAPYEIVMLGQPDSLDGGGLDAVRWFVEERGGVAVLVPDRVGPGRYPELFGGMSFDTRTLDTPVALQGLGAGLMAAELAIARALPPMAFLLAADAAGAPVVFGIRRGQGAVIVSGALDAWRYRDRQDAAFARFWRTVILQQAAAVPPLVEVTATPSLARPGDAVRVTARLRATELSSAGDRVALPPASARALHATTRDRGSPRTLTDAHGSLVESGSPRTRTDTHGSLVETGRPDLQVRRGESVIRLWPAAEPGTYEGEWRPEAAGDYVVDVSVGAASGASIVTVAPDVAASGADPEALAIAARASGGDVVTGLDALVRTLTDRFPARTVTRPFHPARSPWYAAVFALLLCGEWAVRRRRGLS